MCMRMAHTYVCKLICICCACLFGWIVGLCCLFVRLFGAVGIIIENVMRCLIDQIEMEHVCIRHIYIYQHFKLFQHLPKIQQNKICKFARQRARNEKPIGE